MRVLLPMLRGPADQRVLHGAHVLARRERGPVPDPEDMGVDRDRRLPERDVEDDVGRFPTDPGQGFESLAVLGNPAAEVGDEALRERDHVLRLVAVEPDGTDVVAELRLAQPDHLLRRVGDGEQRACRLVHADIGRLRGQDDGDEQRIGVPVFELALRRRHGPGQATVELVDMGERHRARHRARVAPTPPGSNACAHPQDRIGRRPGPAYDS